MIYFMLTIRSIWTVLCNSYNKLITMIIVDTSNTAVKYNWNKIYYSMGIIIAGWLSVMIRSAVFMFANPPPPNAPYFSIYSWQCTTSRLYSLCLCADLFASNNSQWLTLCAVMWCLSWKRKLVCSRKKPDKKYFWICFPVYFLHKDVSYLLL